MTKKIGQIARPQIEELVGSQVYLELWVKVRPKWRHKEEELRWLGYTLLEAWRTQQSIVVYAERMQENLARGLSLVSRAVSSRATLPVLSNVLLKTQDGGLRLTATNLEIGISAFIGLEVEIRPAAHGGLVDLSLARRRAPRRPRGPHRRGRASRGSGRGWRRGS